MTIPNFLIIGAIKGGTTSIYHYLKQHPQIYMSSVKEPRFFAVEADKPPDQGMNRYAITDIEVYRALFKGVSDEKAIGEASPQYLYSPQAPERIKCYIPDAKLIAILRNPVDRAYSAFLHLAREGAEPLTDFAQALHEEQTRIRRNWGPLWHYKKVGFYYAQLKRYFDTFDRGQIRVYLYEDLNTNVIGVLRDIFRFLSVDDSFVPDVSLRHNVSGIPRSGALQAFVVQPNPVQSILKPLLPKELRRRIKISLNNWNLVKPQLPPEVRRELAKEFREDILKLQDLIQRDLSRWLE